MNREETMQELRVFAARIRLETMRIMGSFGKGHVGGSMSLADAFAVLYGKFIHTDPENPLWEDRDYCVLSKGHAGPVMYATLGLKGYFPVEEAYTLNQNGTNFPSHTDHLKTPGVDLTTGSLGQGISEAAGAALGNRLQGRKNYVYVFLGDGECDEGQVWEAAQFSAHYHLDHLIALVDENGRQLDGPTAEVMSHAKGIGAKFDAFGWRVIDVADGNDVAQIYDAITEAKTPADGPTAVILHTVKGKGASFAEPTGEHSSSPKKEVWEESIRVCEENLKKVLAEKEGSR